MKNQVLHTVWCNISGETAGEIWTWSLLGVKGLKEYLQTAYRWIYAQEKFGTVSIYGHIHFSIMWHLSYLWQKGMTAEKLPPWLELEDFFMRINYTWSDRVDSRLHVETQQDE